MLSNRINYKCIFYTYKDIHFFYLNKELPCLSKKNRNRVRSLGRADLYIAYNDWCRQNYLN